MLSYVEFLTGLVCQDTIRKEEGQSSSSRRWRWGWWKRGIGRLRQKGKDEGRKEKEEISSYALWEKLSPDICDICLVWRLQCFNNSTFQKMIWSLELARNDWEYICICMYNICEYVDAFNFLIVINHHKRKKRYSHFFKICFVLLYVHGCFICTEVIKRHVRLIFELR